MVKLLQKRTVKFSFDVRGREDGYYWVEGRINTLKSLTLPVYLLSLFSKLFQKKTEQYNLTCLP